MSDESVELVWRVFVFVPLTGTSHSNPERNIAAAEKGGKEERKEEEGGTKRERMEDNQSSL